MSAKKDNSGVMSEMSTVGAGSENVVRAGVLTKRESPVDSDSQPVFTETGTMEFSLFASQRVEKIAENIL